MSRMLITCEKCGKRLLRRLPNGCFEFVFGLPKNYGREIGRLEDYKKRLSGLRGDAFWIEVVRLLTEFPELWGFVNVEKKEFDNHDSVINDLIAKRKEDQKTWRAPVVMTIHGSVKMVCLRKTCGHVNLITFFPPIVEDDKNPAETKTKIEGR